jgi:putative membrane protein
MRLRRCTAATATLTILSATPAFAHDGRALAPHDLWHAWSVEPLVVAALIVSAGLYIHGVRALWHNAGTGHGLRRWQAGSFAAGWLVLAVALVSPLHRLGAVLFSAHMVQHELLMVVAAPLLVLGRPVVAWLWSVPTAWRHTLGGWAAAAPVRSTWGLVTLPAVAWMLHAAAIWVWHAPGLYQATLESELVHGLQHTSFLASALLFWWALLPGRAGRLGGPAGIVYLFTTAVHTTVLGALLTLSSRVWYPLYDTTTTPWGLTALEDQQLAGLIMWVPAGLAYLGAALALAASWLRDPKPRGVVAHTFTATVAPLLILAAVLSGCSDGAALSKPEAARLTGGNPDHGAVAIRSYGCGSCHTIPGIRGANALVGPPLAGIGGRSYIAGVLTNSPDNLTRWIQHPQQVDPLTAMPDLGVSEADARDIASYLYTRR